MGLATHLVTRAGLVALLLAVPSGAVLAMATVDSSLRITNLTIKPASGTLSILDLSGSPVGPLGSSAAAQALGVSAGTNAFNSLGESDAQSQCNTIYAVTVGSCNNVVTGTAVSASAAVTYAQGNTQASALPGSVGASASVNIPSGTVLAGVTLNGSVADLTGTFTISGASTNPVDVSLSMQVSGSLSGVSDAFGFLQTGDLTAELDIDGTPELFDLESLPGLPSVAGVNNYPNTTCTIPPDTSCTVFSQTSATVPLDPTISHSFDLHADAEVQAFNAVPAPLIGHGLPVLLAVGGVLFGALLSWEPRPLLLAGLGALTWRPSARASRPREHNKASRHS